MDVECMPTSLDIFSKIPENTNIDEVVLNEYQPLSAVIKNVIEFTIAGDPSSYIDLSSLRLLIRICVKAKNGEINIAKQLNLIPLWPQCLFKQIDATLGQWLVSTSNNNYHYRAMMETSLSYSTDTKTNVLKACEHWEGTKVENSEEIEAYIPLHLDITNQPNLLLSNIDLRLRLLRNEDNYVLLTHTTDTESYFIEMKKITLFVRKIVPSATILLDHARKLANENAKYFINKVHVKDFNLARGQTSYNINNVFLGKLPFRMVVGMIKADAYNGDKKLNPFLFEHFSLNNISILSNGKCIPNVPYEPDFSKKRVCREYWGLYEALLGDCALQDSIGISIDDFISGGKTLFAFVLPNVLGGHQQVRNIPSSGYINLRLKFAEQLKENVTCVVYGEYESTIEIDSNRNVYIF